MTGTLTANAWLWLPVITGLLGTAALLARMAWHSHQQAHTGWSAAAVLAGLLFAAALLLALKQQPVWGVGQVVTTLMVTLAHLAGRQPTALWTSR